MTAESEHIVCVRYDPCAEQHLHALTDVERTLAEHFLNEVYEGHGEIRRAFYAPEPVAEMIRHDPHYFMCEKAIREARRLLLAFPDLSLSPEQGTP